MFIRNAGDPTADGTWAGKQTNWLPPAGARRAFKAGWRLLAKSPTAWRCWRSLPSLAFLPPHVVVCSVVVPAQPQAGSWHLPGAGGRRGQALPPSQAPRRGNSDPEPTERCFLCVSTMLWFGGLAASLELEGFLGPLLNIHLLVKKPAQLKLPALSSCQSGGPPSQKIPLLDQIAVAGMWRHSFCFLPAPPSPPGSMHFSTARFWKQLTLGCKKPRVRMEASTPSSAKAGCHLPGDTWVTCRVTAPEHLRAGCISPCTASSRGWGTH